MPTTLIGDGSKRRIFALAVDNLLSLFLAFFTASRLPDLGDSARAAIVAVVYLLYFFLLEGMWSITIGKLAFGLRVCQLDGTKAGWTIAAIRTMLRIVEVNPILGMLPGGLAVAFSKRHQRFGDMLSRAVVARRPSPEEAGRPPRA